MPQGPTTKAAQASPSRARELDQETLRLAQRGDRLALRQVVETYERRVFAAIGRLVGHDGPVGDLAQETFLRVFGALPDFQSRGPAKLSTWILTIATRLAIDELRRRKRAPSDADVLEIADWRPSPERLQEARDLGQRVQLAVEALPVAFRATFVLATYHELEHKEIAQILDCDVGTVKSRLSRARRLVRRTLDAEKEPNRG